jgi:hypothetical protein
VSPVLQASTWQARNQISTRKLDYSSYILLLEGNITESHY